MEGQLGPVQVTPESQMDMAVNRVLSTRDCARVPGKAINKKQGNLKWDFYGAFPEFHKFLPQNFPS